MASKSCSCTAKVNDIVYEVDICHCPLHKAAPELLEACKRALPIVQSYNATLSGVEVLEAAIAAAEGKL